MILVAWYVYYAIWTCLLLAYYACEYSIPIHECILCSSHTPSSLFEGTEPLHCIGSLQQILMQ